MCCMCIVPSSYSDLGVSARSRPLHTHLSTRVLSSFVLLTIDNNMFSVCLCASDVWQAFWNAHKISGKYLMRIIEIDQSIYSSDQLWFLSSLWAYFVLVLSLAIGMSGFAVCMRSVGLEPTRMFAETKCCAVISVCDEVEEGSSAVSGLFLLWHRLKPVSIHKIHIVSLTDH